MSEQETETRKGTIYGALAYSLWGAFPLYFHALIPAGAWEVLTHRILWTMLLCVVILVATRQIPALWRLLKDRQRLAYLSAASFFIAANWVIYVVAVMANRTSEAALGYFLNPLVTVALGVIVLHERLRRLQWAAVAVGGVACVYLAVTFGKPPWISLALAGSFATYGLIKNRVGGAMTPLQSLSAETVILSVPAVPLLIWITAQNEGTFTGYGAGHTALLVFSGAATAVPLLLFAAAARRIPLSLVGLLQFATPILQLLCGVLLLHEVVPTSRWVGFGIVWVALVLLTIDSLRSAANTRRRRRIPPAG
ncbi:EamA family transporter RarD [Demetria terragena]|uniref:EamA family transporter RarD n=1 Tax=Demetria terragena TaxID=63959 RepID=UPI00036AAC64|nr:EamA family transporter RarD [Demetria terragena]